MAHLYFAYGSNMAAATMRDRGVDARWVGGAELSGYRLAFTLPSRRWTGRAADVLPDRASTVFGVLWSLTDPNAIDPYETRYDRIPVQVRQLGDSGGEPTEAFTYAVKAEHRASLEAPPAIAYLERMVEGATSAELPEHYVAALRSLAG